MVDEQRATGCSQQTGRGTAATGRALPASHHPHRHAPQPPIPPTMTTTRHPLYPCVLTCSRSVSTSAGAMWTYRMTPPRMNMLFTLVCSGERAAGSNSA